MDMPVTIDPATPDGLRGAALYRSITILLLVSTIEGYDVNAIGIAAPVIAKQLAIDPFHIGQIFAVAQVGLVLGALIGGILGDRVGRRTILIAGMLFFGIFSFTTALGTGFLSLALGRLLEGVGVGFALPNLITMGVALAPARHRVKVVSIILMGASFGGVIVAFVGAPLIHALGWRSLFYVGGLFPLLFVPLVLNLPNIRSRADSRGRSAALAWHRALFADTRATTTALLWIALFLSGSMLYIMANWLPSLMAARGLSLELSNLAQLIFNASGIVGTLLIGPLIDRAGYQRVLPLAYGLCLIGVVGLTVAQTTVPLVLSVSLTGFSLLPIIFAFSGIYPIYYPAEARGFGTGIAVMVGRVGSIAGPLAAGYVLLHGFGPVAPSPAAVAAAMIPAVLIGAFAVTVLGRQARMLDRGAVSAQPKRD
jgi:AAHS family 3-hydroxyphenylpropionic acid transporter